MWTRVLVRAVSAPGPLLHRYVLHFHTTYHTHLLQHHHWKIHRMFYSFVKWREEVYHWRPPCLVAEIIEQSFRSVYDNDWSSHSHSFVSYTSYNQGLLLKNTLLYQVLAANKTAELNGDSNTTTTIANTRVRFVHTSNRTSTLCYHEINTLLGRIRWIGTLSLRDYYRAIASYKEAIARANLG